MPYHILVLPGDGIGPEIIAEAVKVLQVVSKSTGTCFTFQHALFGGCSIDKYGVPVTREVLEQDKASSAVLFGAVGGPKRYVAYLPTRNTPSTDTRVVHRGAGLIRPEEAILTLRQELCAFANVRPCKFASQSLIALGPVRPELTRDTYFVIVRENCGGAYFGDKVEQSDFACDPWSYTTAEVERVSRLAAALAMRKDPPLQVVSCDKADVLASSRLWRRTVSRLYEREHPQIHLTHRLADSAAILKVKDPRSLNGVVLADNT